MLLGIFSDSHLGFPGEDRFEEAFDRFKESIDIFHKNKVDFILHAGDLFDSAVPEQEVWLKTFKAFSQNIGQASGLNNSPGIEKSVDFLGQFSVLIKTHFEKEFRVRVKGIPVIAIHGTHEFRGRDFANALDVLEESHCLVHLHAGYCVLEKGGERVFVHGMGGVPEKHAREALQKYSPKPIEGHTNILLLHQSFTDFLPFDDDSIASLSLTDLPQGFDLIINGHLHWTDELDVDGRRFLLAGSSIFTQMKRLEAKKEKGVFLFETSSKELTFVPFSIQRKLFYEKIEFKDARPDEVVVRVNSLVDSYLANNNFKIKPLIRLKLTGTLAKGFNQSDLVLDFSRYNDKAVFSVSKNIGFVDFRKKMDGLKELHSSKKSVLDFGVEILEKNVLEAGLSDFDTRRIFELLSSGEIEKVEELLLLD